ncbi:hypothetical protein RRG08_038071 [Elysia crispata]|uniref:Uncharacterized protein n=1 Tax=Elysia crispata TaxID=231223 RepID=A0AAE1A077_9GAST|nr:hypothetical protein RRG08_038071 [Elysia crispata]
MTLKPPIVARYSINGFPASRGACQRSSQLLITQINFSLFASSPLPSQSPPQSTPPLRPAFPFFPITSCTRPLVPENSSNFCAYGVTSVSLNLFADPTVLFTDINKNHRFEMT